MRTQLVLIVLLLAVLVAGCVQNAGTQSPVGAEQLAANSTDPFDAIEQQMGSELTDVSEAELANNLV